MKKRSIVIILAAVLAVNLNGCSFGDRTDTGGNTASGENASDKSTPVKEGNITGSAQSVSPAALLSPSPSAASPSVPQKDQAVPILVYHSISYQKGNTIRLPADKFREQMKWLSDNGYHTVNFDDLYSHYIGNTPLPSKPVILTFDDGYSDNYDAAFPILKEFGFKAVIYIITNTVDRSYGYMTRFQIQDMAKYGISFGCHTDRHIELDKLSYQDQLNAVRNSKEALEKVLGAKVTSFAYPVGKYNNNTLKILRQEGFTTAVTMNRGWARKSDGLLTLNRVFIGSDYGMNIFRIRLTNPQYWIAESQLDTAVAGVSTIAPETTAVGTSVTETADEKKKRLDDLYLKGYDLFIKQGKYQEAINIQNRVISEDPLYYKAYSVLGIALCYTGNLQGGMQNIDKALELKPEYGYGRFNKALAYELWGRYDQSLEWYDRALEVENYVWSYYGKASIYGRRGDVANTVFYLKKAFTFGDFVKNEAKAEHDFDPVRSSPEFQELFK